MMSIHVCTPYVNTWWSCVIFSWAFINTLTSPMFIPYSWLTVYHIFNTPALMIRSSLLCRYFCYYEMLIIAHSYSRLFIAMMRITISVFLGTESYLSYMLTRTFISYIGITCTRYIYGYICDVLMCVFSWVFIILLRVQSLYHVRG